MFNTTKSVIIGTLTGVANLNVSWHPTYFLPVPVPDDLRGAAREALRLQASQGHGNFLTATTAVGKKKAS